MFKDGKIVQIRTSFRRAAACTFDDCAERESEENLAGGCGGEADVSGPYYEQCLVSLLSPHHLLASRTKTKKATKYRTDCHLETRD